MNCRKVLAVYPYTYDVFSKIVLLVNNKHELTRHERNDLVFTDVV